MYYYVVIVISAILQDFSALIFKVKQSFFLDCMALNKKAL